MKVTAAESHTAQFDTPHICLFNVLMSRRYPSPNGVGVHTSIINAVPLTYADAMTRVQGLLKPLVQGVPGFQSVTDCWMEPVDLNGFTFANEADRDAWLLDVVRGMMRAREERELEQHHRENAGMIVALADAIAANAGMPARHDATEGVTA